jgi:hypothetical protein
VPVSEPRNFPNISLILLISASTRDISVHHQNTLRVRNLPTFSHF